MAGEFKDFFFFESVFLCCCVAQADSIYDPAASTSQVLGL
jgi:hypothetical protein